MLDPKRAANLIRKHFAELTTEQFLENLKKSSPELFEEDNNNSEILPDETKELNNEVTEKPARA